MMAFPFNPHKWGEVDSLTVRLPQLDATILLYLHGDLGHLEGAQPVNSFFIGSNGSECPSSSELNEDSGENHDALDPIDTLDVFG